MEKELLLLGLLRQQEMHGYQLNELIDAHLGTTMRLTRPTAYRLLDHMAQRGWVRHHDEREGHRPTRRVYALTDQGERAFQRLLRQSLAGYDPAAFPSDISLAFLGHLDPDESIGLLRQRQARIVALTEALPPPGLHHGAFEPILDHQRYHLEAEIAWVDDLIDAIVAGQTASPESQSQNTVQENPTA